MSSVTIAREELKQKFDLVPDRYLPQLSQIITAVDNAENNLLLQFDQLQAEYKTEEFQQLCQQTDWQSVSLPFFLQIIDMALGLGLHTTATELTATAQQRFPTQPDLIKLARLLAPPAVVPTTPTDQTTRHANRLWLTQNRAVYQDQWVALQNGIFIAAHPSLPSLRQQLPQTQDVYQITLVN
jgi:hypothetical protein